jgi:hypothetical protein
VPHELQPGQIQTPRKSIPRKPAPALPPTLQAGRSSFRISEELATNQLPPPQGLSTESLGDPRGPLYPFNPDGYGRQEIQGPGVNQLGYSNIPRAVQFNHEDAGPGHQGPIYGGGNFESDTNYSPMQQYDQQQERPTPKRMSSSELSTAGLKNKWKRFIS